MARELSGSVALVTGGAQRLGRATARALAQAGASVVVHYDRSSVAAEQLVEEMRGAGARAWCLRADLRELGELHDLVGRAAAFAGPLSILVNNASAFPRTTFETVTRADLLSSVELDAWAPFELARRFAEGAPLGAHVVNMVDTRVVAQYDWQHFAYCAAKHVLALFTELLALRLALGVRGPGIPGTESFSTTGQTIPAFGVILQALTTAGDTDVLSTPHILATDNIKAEINVGQNIPLQTNIGGIPTTGAAGAAGSLPFGGVGFGASPARQDVGTKITITPHLNESNEVRLELAEEISEAGDAVGQLGVVPITKRTATTQLIVKDQQTVVIGGLMRNRIAHQETKIPVLGDIPLLGVLFRQTTNTVQKSNLLLVLTPYIIREQSDLRTIFERKMQERQ